MHFHRMRHSFLTRISLRKLTFVVALDAVLLIAFGANTPLSASTEECTIDSAWKRVRKTFPIHDQGLARCENQRTGRTVVVLTEPPPHIPADRANEIIRALFTVSSDKIELIQKRRNPLGFDGWAEDLVILVDTRDAATKEQLYHSLAMLAALAFGSTYKAEVRNIDRMFPTSGMAPPPLEVSKEELSSWFFGPNAQKLLGVTGASSATLQERAARNETGTFYSETPGLVVAILPRGSGDVLNNYIADVRRFVVDSDAFIGAIKLNDRRVALIGRERTTSQANMAPLRLETIFLLASERSFQLSQSYERRRPFAGKLLATSEELLGWDWAPILLSDSIIDTEFGSLLNFTDNMLKSWSEGGQISYKGFLHPQPPNFPFGLSGAFRSLKTSRLTYNWNTAGVGLVSSINGLDIFVLRNTGSLPVSYFPEGSIDDDEVAKAKLSKAEDDAYFYFRSLRNPLLERAVQYAALFQVFLAFDMRANRPHDLAPASATMSHLEDILSRNVKESLGALQYGAGPTINELWLRDEFIVRGTEAAKRLLSQMPPPDVRQELDKRRANFKTTSAVLEAIGGPTWKEEVAKVAAQGESFSPKVSNLLDPMIASGIRLVRSPDAVRQQVVKELDHNPTGWIRTPSIVVSRGDENSRQLTGGHNIGGRATRVVIDPTVPKGHVKASGDYAEGRVLRLNPADKDAEQEVVRLFDREVGLLDENAAKGIRAIETRLATTPITARPIRVIDDALQFKPGRTTRGASPDLQSIQIGYDLESTAVRARPQFDGIIQGTGADVLVAPSPPAGYLVIRPRPAPPKTIATPNATSMYEAVENTIRDVSLGPPALAKPKIVFSSTDKADVVRHVDSLYQRGAAVAGAGGKPPFGGNRGLFGFADGPDPQRPFMYSAMKRTGPSPKHEGSTFENAWDRMKGWVGRRSERLHVEPASAANYLKARPRWSDAEIRFPKEDETLLISTSSNSGHMHIVEVTVPITIETRSQSLLIRAMAWFKDKPEIAKLSKLEADSLKVFKNSADSALEDAFARYKELMLRENGATNIEINLSNEGRDIVIVQTIPSHDRNHT
ncbi:hypothetical protein I6F09_33520 [Bradyrhizobium sp. IC3195]|uniref:hypothetical protein n=1 Tax=Bradyrhizobium sp. IC3195 TaxID=2793804 RepID=UPI001CD2E802|nr:hypothetical protein [Bradyrhizobium sp. IC3195]MCA1472773.1 hypothetical protein [Bradyrhizobium sp. IC3195]